MDRMNPIAPIDPIDRDKRRQRQQGIAARRALDGVTRAAAEAAICAAVAASPVYQAAGTLLLYCAAGGEVDLSALAARAEAEGKVVAWPVCLPGHQLAAAVPLGPDSWETGRYGIRAPVLARSRVLPPEALDLIVVPCTAFDAGCRRVGMGGGYYDRYLPRCTGARCWGVAFEAQRVDRAAVAAHDRVLDGFVTERRMYMATMTQWSCEDFLAALASREAVPGGGGASALAAALGMALGHMVGNLTVGKKKYAAVEDDIRQLNARAETLQQELTALVQADAAAFEPLSRAYGLPKGTEEERAHKAAVMEAALKDACAVPLEILRKTGEALELVADYADKGSAIAISDAGVAAALCRGALEGAALNVYINTKAMADRACAADCNAQCAALLARYVPLAEQVYAQVRQRVGG